MRDPDRRLRHDLDCGPQRAEDDPQARQADDEHRDEKADEIGDVSDAAAQALFGVAIQ